MNLLNRLLPLLTEGQMPQQYRRIKRQRIHILRRRRIHLARPRQNRTLGLRLRRRNNIRNPHQLEQPLTLLVVLARHAHRPAGKLLHLFGRACLLGFLVRGSGFGFALEALCEFAGFELRWGAVEDVDGFYAVVDDAEGAVEEAH